MQSGISIFAHKLSQHLVWVVAWALIYSVSAEAATAQGSFIPVPLPTNNLNLDIRDLSTVYNGKVSGTQTFDNVPFEMRTGSQGDNALMVPIPGPALLSSTTASNTYSISTSIYGARAVYALINSVYDSSSGESITFIASDGTLTTTNLAFGQNVRRYTGSKSLNSTVTKNVVGTESGAHLDMQRFDLPASFATKTLTEIRFTSRGVVPSSTALLLGALRTGFSFLAGLTVDAVAAPAQLLANYTMEDNVAWSGAAGELKDTASSSGGPYNGRAIGSPVPVQAFLTPARSGASNGTCQYAQLNGPASNGGAFQLTNLPINTIPTAQNSVSFWMYWNGADMAVPLGWNEYKLIFKNGLFGFDSGDGRMYARSSSGLANGWRHISAVFSNLDMASNKIYVDGVLQTLTMSGTKNLVSSINSDELATTLTTPTWAFVSPPTGWKSTNQNLSTDSTGKLKGFIEVGRPAYYGVSGATTNYVIEIEADPGDDSLYTEINTTPGEKFSMELDYAARAGYTSGDDSSIRVLVDDVLVTTLRTNSSTFSHQTIDLGYSTKNTIKIEFRSVDADRFGGLLNNIQIFREREVATSTLTIGGFGNETTNRFIGNIDEVKVYKGAITQAQVNADYAETHQCLALHHARLNHAGSGVTCAPAQIGVYGCSNPDLNGVCTPSVVAFTGTVVAQNNGVTVATAPFSIPAGQSFTLVELNVPNPQSTTLNIVNYNIPPYGNPQTTCWDGSSNTTSCQFSFNDAGFIISNTLNGSSVNLPNQVAGVNSSVYYLRAVQKNTSTGACQAALTGDQNINFGYVCNNPTTCAAGNLMKVGKATFTGAVIESSNFFPGSDNANGFVNSSPINLTFDSNGNAPFWLNYYDAGQTTLHMFKLLPGGARLGGNSNAFITKPYNFTISNITNSSNVANPAASSASGAKFVKAGESFKATINANAANGWLTKNFGREIVPENVRLDAFLQAPTGGSAGVMAGNITSAGSFVNGSATLTGVSWSEVGIIQLLPVVTDNDYLGAGSVWGISSDNIGRFYPDHFRITVGTDTKACSNQFTYFGQDGLNTAFTLSAENMSNGITRNYSGTYSSTSFMKFNTSARSQYEFSTSPSFTLDPSATAITGTWLNGVGSINAKHILRKPASRTAPTSITFNAHPVDDDGVTITTSSAPISAATPFRYGRMFMQSMHGSELIALPIRLETQFWDGNGYVRNTLDSCSSVSLSSVSMKNYHGNLNACETRLTGVASLVNGSQVLTLTAPGVTGGIPNSGSVDLEVNLNAAVPGEKVCLTSSESNATSAGMPWLIDNSTEPVGRATFGRNRVPMIYMRENF
ncbi:DUF6701 domain-containing protein [Methylophilus sp.]|uniref:DUF6701 domain-containing protein n=1 Tax=Methylophilus sp. TaxID=29541 RepID=UPI000D46EAE5|nr:DUF6701 domain-containing protein [Methylophilus sp.]PPD12070.1 MAG: hypothetical protein CTY26_06790 [Methylophilus sp.]